MFGHRDYPVNSTVDALLALSKSVRSHPFRFLLWTEDRKGFREYHDGQSIPETEYGYSTKEQLFFNECTSRGDRWRYEIVSEYATLWGFLRKEQYQAVVICGEDLTSLASRAIYYFDRVPLGPKTVILAFHNRLIEHSHLYRLWSFLKGQNRLHLLKNLAYLNSSPSSRKFLQMISTRFEEAASNFKIRSLEVLDKGLLLIKVFHSVEPLGGKKTAKGHIEYPVRSGRITIWKSLKSTER